MKYSFIANKVNLEIALLMEFKWLDLDPILAYISTSDDGHSPRSKWLQAQ